MLETVSVICYKVNNASVLIIVFLSGTRIDWMELELNITYDLGIDKKLPDENRIILLKPPLLLMKSTIVIIEMDILKEV